MFPSGNTYTIPQEILDEIIDYISTDKTSLKACSLASHSCLHPAQRHLFSEIKISNHASSIRLSSIIRQNPQLTSHMRSLRICPNITAYHGRQFYRISARSDNMVFLLQSLRDHLQTFTYIAFSLDWRPFNTLSPELRAAFFGIFTAPNLVNISVTTWDRFPVAVFAGCPRLKQLKLVNITLSDGIVLLPGVDEPGSTNIKGKLEVLEVNSDGAGKAVLEAMTKPQSKLDISSLRHLSVSENYARSEPVWDLLYPSATSLCSLSISMTIHTPADECLSYLGEMISLKSLLISYQYGAGSEDYEDLLPWLAPSLAQGTVPSALEKFTLKLKTEPNVIDLDSLHDCAVWGSLDKILSSAVYPQLRTLEICLTVTSFDNTGSGTAIVEDLTAQMPATKKAGVLLIDMSLARYDSDEFEEFE